MMSAKTQCQAMHAIFAEGFNDASLGVALQTAREVETRYPEFRHMETTLYLNGAEDGARGDRFRLDMECGLCGKGAKS